MKRNVTNLRNAQHHRTQIMTSPHFPKKKKKPLRRTNPCHKGIAPECTAVAAIRLLRMRILMRPKNSLESCCHLRINSLAIANGFAKEVAKLSFSLRKFLANGRLRQNSLVIANAMAWCTQDRSNTGSAEMLFLECDFRSPEHSPKRASKNAGCGSRRS